MTMDTVHFINGPDRLELFFSLSKGKNEGRNSIDFLIEQAQDFIPTGQHQAFVESVTRSLAAENWTLIATIATAENLVVLGFCSTTMNLQKGTWSREGDCPSFLELPDDGVPMAVFGPVKTQFFGSLFEHDNRHGRKITFTAEGDDGQIVECKIRRIDRTRVAGEWLFEAIECHEDGVRGRIIKGRYSTQQKTGILFFV